jgi:alanyl-tRNA synthetase
MKQLTGNQTRKLFLDFFESKGHMIEPGASLVPVNDPTLLWINAGVAALKKYFDGSEKPRCNRICNAQKSIRTNDIENVGKTARHHTFFEMLGNFSIGDYFKDEAIQYAWEFLTSPEWVGFDKEKMYISVYSDDETAYNIWVNICGVDPSHILRTDDNFWQIGEGPSGPDSEIFYDRGDQYDPEGLGEKLFFEEIDNDRYIEVWNVVFSQYDAKDGIDRKNYKELPQKNIDTGMGLERLVSLIQGGETNFDTDLFLPIIKEIEKMSNFPYEGEYKMAYRVIADHIRTVTFAICDGASFSNEGRGYVLRRVLRRAVRYGLQLGIKGSFMYKLVPTVVEIMKDFYPYLTEKIDFVQTLVKKEEEAFHTTLSNGEKLLNEAMKNADNGILEGEVIFKLYDTFGFPKELTTEIAQDNGYKVDLDGFKIEMNKQKLRAKNARSSSESMKSQSEDLMNFKEDFKFVGYNECATSAIVTGLFVNGNQVNVLDDEGDIIFDKTTFYAESGGQSADTGIIFNKNVKAKVVNTQKATNGQFLHHVVIEEGSEIKVDDVFELMIDETKRRMTKANHSSLHLLQSALIKVLGNHISQAGSYCCPDYARFDFSHFEKVNKEQIDQIEIIVNEFIARELPVSTQVLTIDEAKQTNAIALFDEKYGDFVRVVTMGDASVEFCGGTHVSNTSNLGLFKIDFEESIGSGIRRIQCKTKLPAYNDFKNYEKTLEIIAKDLKMKSINDIDIKVKNVIEENNSLKKELSKINEKLMLVEANEVVDQAEVVNGLKVIILKLNNFDGKALKSYAETLRNKATDSVVFIANIINEEKVTFVAAVSKSAIVKDIKANDLVKIAATMSDGKGGGKPDLAQSGGKNINIVDDIIVVIKELINNK